MRRAILSALLVAAAIVLQLTVVNRLALPGGGEPDLVLLVVVALGLCGGPVPGALTGFAAGLCLDLAPPASALIGEYALVFCVIGFCCGKLRGALSQSALLALGTAAAAAAVGEALYAAVGLTLDRAQVTVASVRQLLPSSVGYDVALTPIVLVAVLQAVRLADERGPGALGGPAQRADGAALLDRAAANGLVRRPGPARTIGRRHRAARRSRAARRYRVAVRPARLQVRAPGRVPARAERGPLGCPAGGRVDRQRTVILAPPGRPGPPRRCRPAAPRCRGSRNRGAQPVRPGPASPAGPGPARRPQAGRLPASGGESPPGGPARPRRRPPRHVLRRPPGPARRVAGTAGHGRGTARWRPGPQPGVPAAFWPVRRVGHQGRADQDAHRPPGQPAAACAPAPGRRGRRRHPEPVGGRRHHRAVRDIPPRHPAPGRAPVPPALAAVPAAAGGPGPVHRDRA